MPGSYTDGSTWPQGSMPTRPRAETQTCMCAHGGRHRVRRQTHLCFACKVCSDAQVHAHVDSLLCIWPYASESSYSSVHGYQCMQTQCCVPSHGDTHRPARAWKAALTASSPGGFHPSSWPFQRQVHTFSLGSALPVSSCLPPGTEPRLVV